MQLVLTLCALLLTPLTPALAQPLASGGGMLISVESLAAQLKARDLVVLHVADRPSFYEEGHIPGARYLRYADFAVDGPDGLGSELPPAVRGARMAAESR